MDTASPDDAGAAAPVPDHPLAALEARLRPLLPADLYVAAWVQPNVETLSRVFEHLRTLHRILHDYVPRQVSEAPPAPGRVRRAWQDGTLLSTDLAGFTHLVEANLARGRDGAETLLGVLNAYFAEMIEIISKSGGDLLEFTGDALLAQFPPDARWSDSSRAVRAGLRMQRAMAARFAAIETPHGALSLRMRAGVHSGRFLTADIGTPRRMEHVLLGRTVQHTKQAEGAGEVGRVALTRTVCERVQDQFRLEPGSPGHWLAVDDLSGVELGEYDLLPPNRRPAARVLWDRSVPGLAAEIAELVTAIEPLASYLPLRFLALVVEGAARRRISPQFLTPAVIVANLVGPAQAIDHARPDEEAELVAAFSHAIGAINAAVEAGGGVLKKVTYHLAGSDMVIYFGVPHPHNDDARHAAEAALAIREIITSLPAPVVEGRPVPMTCQVGVARGPAFAAEVGEPHGRREFNVLGDTVNTAARLMNHASTNQILITDVMYRETGAKFVTEPLGAVSFKGKAAPTPIRALLGLKEGEELDAPG